VKSANVVNGSKKNQHNNPVGVENNDGHEDGGYASSELKALWCSKGRQLITR
jgi:hypothetical protein